jgi:hypothetical protein
MDFIAALNMVGFGGFYDWRLPKIDELFSIVNHARTKPSIDLAYFPNTQTSYNYWSSTPYVGLSGYIWSFCFAKGYSEENYGTMFFQYARAVRSQK